MTMRFKKECDYFLEKTSLCDLLFLRQMLLIPLVFPSIYKKHWSHFGQSAQNYRSQILISEIFCFTATFIGCL
jgi:hypothetical protein